MILIFKAFSFLCIITFLVLRVKEAINLTDVGWCRCKVRRLDWVNGLELIIGITYVSGYL